MAVVFLSLLGVIAYGGLLRPTWQQRSEAIAEVTKLQQYVEQQVSALAQLPSQALIRQQINTLLSENAWWQKPEILLAHQVGETIMPFGGQVIRWQRYSGSEEAVVENAIAFRRWEATLRVSFMVCTICSGNCQKSDHLFLLRLFPLSVMAMRLP